jgi:FkbM family methyltransferase
MPLLRRNVSDWSSLPIARIEIKHIALSDRNGEARLGFREDYAENSGIASLEIENGGIPVEVFRLDSLDIAHAGVVKVDVEGHETAVFRGARDLLARKAIRDIVFEEYEPYPARSHNVLLEHGYRIFRLTGTAWRPLLSPAEMETNRQANVPINYIASAEPSRVEKRFRHRGWQALSGRLGPNK